MGIRKGLVKRIEEIVRETKSRVRKIGGDFWTARGVMATQPLVV